MAGRKLANSPRCLRRPRIACSGRSARSSLSYFQSPTAPNRMASAALASSSVESGSGWPCASYAAPPTGAVSSSNWRSSTFRTLSASATISVPMPSPGRTAIFMLTSTRNGVGKPRFRREALGLERLDLVRLPQREPDVVEAIEEAGLAERLHVEADRRAAGRGDQLAIEIDRQLVARKRADLVEQLGDDGLWKRDRQQAVLEA